MQRLQEEEGAQRARVRIRIRVKVSRRVRVGFRARVRVGVRVGVGVKVVFALLRTKVGGAAARTQHYPCSHARLHHP